VVKYPKGDPAAKGTLARLDPTLKPARETRLRVVKEDLTISFDRNQFSGMRSSPPLATVTAAYTIENPTDKEIPVDFGFPILRGIYLSPLAMRPKPHVSVTVDKRPVRSTIISNSIIYGIIRQNARTAIENGIGADPELTRLVANVRGVNALGVPTQSDRPQQVVRQQVAAEQQQRPVLQRNSAAYVASARKQLAAYLTTTLKWNDRDAALMVEYVGLDFGKPSTWPRDRWLYHFSGLDKERAAALLAANLGPLAAIGEQKATQLFAQLASHFDKDSAAAYEAIFKAWGGDVRERSIDLETGRVRPREITVGHNDPKKALMRPLGGSIDPTIYARVDFLDANAKITDAEKAACKTVLRNLPVVFTFAPMNLLHYNVTFPAGATQVVTITYKQYAYVDSRGSGSYQLAYVLHPATLWDDFGPINLKILAPKGVTCLASFPTRETRDVKPAAASASVAAAATAPRGFARLNMYEATLTTTQEKTGELFVGIDKAGWDALFPGTAKQPAAAKPVARPLR